MNKQRKQREQTASCAHIAYIKWKIATENTKRVDTYTHWVYNIPFRTVQNWETGTRKPAEYITALLE